MRILKYKKQIVILCLFTMLFTTFFYKEEDDPMAFPLVLPPIIYALGEIAVSLGCVIASADMLKDFGERIVDNINNSGTHTITDFLSDNLSAIKISAELLKYINSAIEETPTVPIVKRVPVNLTSDGFVRGGITSAHGKTIYATFDLPAGSSFFTVRHYSNGGYRDSKFEVIKLANFSTATFQLEYNSYYDRYELSLMHGILLHGYLFMTLEELLGYDGFGIKSNNGLEAYNGVNIPYSPDTTSGYNKDKPITTFPGVSAGTHTGLWELPLTDEKDDYVGEFPLTEENVKDKVQEFPRDDAETDKPVVGVPEAPSIPTVPDVTVPESGLDWLDSLGKVLEGLINGIIGGLNSLIKGINSILGYLAKLFGALFTFLKELIIPKEFNNLDFTPLYMSFADKFPFCIPFFIADCVSQFNASPKEPIFYVDMSGFSSGKTKGSVGFEIDFTQFEKLFGIVRTFTLISFIVMIAFKTRDLIRG